MKLRLHLVRHGQTLFNRYNRLQGWSNSPLTDQGLHDAHTAGEKLAEIPFKGAFCSDTTRAIDTATIVMQANHYVQENPVELISDMHFREQCYGYFEGQDMAMAWWAAGAPHGAGTYADIVEKYGIAATRDFLKEVDPFSDAESDDEYWSRIEGQFTMIKGREGLQDGDDVLVISHGNTLLNLMQRFAPAGYDLSVRPKNGSVTVLEFTTNVDVLDDALRVLSYNQ